MKSSPQNQLSGRAKGQLRVTTPSFGRGRLIPSLITLACAAALALAPQAAAGVRAVGQTTSVNFATAGQCTDGAMQKWFDASGSYPAFSGNAKDWAASAQAGGWTVVTDPEPRSLVVFQPGVQGAGGYGHVAWVNSIDGSSINITEMNNSQHGGVGAWWTRDVQNVPGMSYILLP